MTDWFYPVAFSSWGPQEREAIARVIKSDRYTMGPECEAFEAEFAQYHAMKHGIMVNSGSSANLIAIAALCQKEEKPLQPGDTCLVPAIAWSTTYSPLIQHGLDLLVNDVDATWGACPNLRPDGFDKCRLIIGCSILGNPAYLERWRDIAKGIGAYFIEDNAESLGAQVGTMADLKRCGTFGLLNTFSFFHSHQLSAIEGGMILTDDDELANLCRLLRNHGNAGFLHRTPEFAESYDFRLMGYNVRPLELHAAIARAQLPKLEEFRRVRQQNLNNFAVLTQQLPIRLQQRNLPGIPSPFGIAFSVASKEIRSALVRKLRENGIDCRLPTGGSFLRHEYGKRWSNQKTPHADWFHDTALFLGLAPFDMLPQIEKAVAVMKEIL